MIDILSFAFGYALGYATRFITAPRKERPLRLVRYDCISPSAIASATLDQMWATNMQAFTLQGDLVGGISERMMVGAGVCTNRAYRRYAGILREAGIWTAAERAKTRYAPGWCGAKVRSYIRRHKLALPYPNVPPPLLGKPACALAVRADAGR